MNEFVGKELFEFIRMNYLDSICIGEALFVKDAYSFSFEISCSKEAYFVLYFDAPSKIYSPNFTVKFNLYANPYKFDTNTILPYNV